MNSRQRRKRKRQSARNLKNLTAGLKKFEGKDYIGFIGDVMKSVHAKPVIPKITVTNTPQVTIGEAKFMQFFRVPKQSEFKHYVTYEGAARLRKEGIKEEDIIIVDEIMPYDKNTQQIVSVKKYTGNDEEKFYTLDNEPHTVPDERKARLKWRE